MFLATKLTEDKKRTFVYACLQASKKPMEIVRFLGYKKSTIFAIKKRFDVEVMENGGVVSGVGEPSPARKAHNCRNVLQRCLTWTS